MVDMMSATRAYEADVAATQAIKAMAQQAIAIAKGLRRPAWPRHKGRG